MKKYLEERGFIKRLPSGQYRNTILCPKWVWVFTTVENGLEEVYPTFLMLNKDNTTIPIIIETEEQFKMIEEIIKKTKERKDEGSKTNN